MKDLSFILAIAVLLIASCTDSDLELDEMNYLVFGHFYGECIGEECVETFKLTSRKLYEDSNDNYRGGDYSFFELENDKFEVVGDLIGQLPKDLLSADENVFGCPDCADQGGLLIQHSEKEGDSNSWVIDQDKDAVPEYLHEFMDEVNHKISLINN